MTKAKISQYDAVAGNNTDVNGVNIAEGCPPSSMNNMGREIMAALKRYQVGSDGDGVTVGGNLVVSGTATANTFTAGAVSATTLNTSGQVVFNDAGANVDFRVEGDTDANLLFVDASTDRVGIGTNTPSFALSILAGNGQIQLGEAGATKFALLESSNGRLFLHSDQGNTEANSDMRFLIDNTERMRIDSSGNLLVGKSSANGSTAGGQILSTGVTAFTTTGDTQTLNVVSNHTGTAGTGVCLFLDSQLTSGTGGSVMAFFNTNAAAYRMVMRPNGNIENTNGTYGTLSSERRFKQDIVDVNSQWDDIKNVRLRKFRLKKDVEQFGDGAQVHLGVIIDELEQVCPGLVTESAECVKQQVAVLDNDGNPVLDENGQPKTEEKMVEVDTIKGWKTSILHLKAVKALQEAMERIETLEAKVAALEAQ